jgi:hypothetical protein
LLLFAIVIAMAAGVAASAQSVPLYDTLTDIQKRLLVGLATPSRKPAPPGPQAQAIFDGATASFRAAFIEVTDALAAVSLSDEENGEILGVALDLVDRVEPLERQPGAASGLSVMLRVTLASGARDRLRRSSEFERASEAPAGADSPLVYRHDGPPSIELIITNPTATVLVR